MVEEGSAENMMITVAIGARADFTDVEVDAATAQVAQYDLAIFQLETNLPATLRAIDRAHAAGVRVLLNPAPIQALPELIYRKLAFATPDELRPRARPGSRPTTMPASDRRPPHSSPRASARSLPAPGVGEDA